MGCNSPLLYVHHLILVFFVMEKITYAYACMNEYMYTGLNQYKIHKCKGICPMYHVDSWPMPALQSPDTFSVQVNVELASA